MAEEELWSGLNQVEKQVQKTTTGMELQEKRGRSVKPSRTMKPFGEDALLT